MNTNIEGPAFRKLEKLKALLRKAAERSVRACGTASHVFSMPLHQMNAPTTSVTLDMPHPKWKMLGGTAEKVHPPGGAHDGRWLDVIAHG